MILKNKQSSYVYSYIMDYELRIHNFFHVIVRPNAGTPM